MKSTQQESKFNAKQINATQGNLPQRQVKPSQATKRKLSINNIRHLFPGEPH
jgi:hypothetical protein